MSADAGAASDARPLQFDAAELRTDGDAPGVTCTACRATIPSVYYEANGAVVCARCKSATEDVRRGAGTSRAGRAVRAMLFGLAGATAGALLYYGVAALTGYEIGLVAIAVGYLVGRAVHAGSGGRGGWRYQAIAVVLTQLAIGAAYFSQGMSDWAKERDGGATASAADSLTVAARATTAATGTEPAAARPAPADAEPMSPLAAAGALLALVGFIAALPIIAGLSDFPQHAIGLLIVGIALHQAWTLNRGASVTFTGPYRVGGTDGPPRPVAG